ncbi:MAG: PIG-L family deacetylase, partial [Bryobacteraceae bacterium]
MTTLVVAAHPDDETLGAGIWMHRQAPDRVHVLHITDGSPQDMHDATLLGFPTRESYARARREEMSGVIQMLGIPPENWNQLEIPDKEAHLHTSQLLTQMAGIIDVIEPALVVTHAYEGGHPDHDTAAFAVALLRKTRRFQLL